MVAFDEKSEHHQLIGFDPNNCTHVTFHLKAYIVKKRLLSRVTARPQGKTTILLGCFPPLRHKTRRNRGL